MKINNVEFDFDVTDIKQLKKAQAAMAAMQEREKMLQAKDRNLSETIQDTIQMLSDFFLEAVGVNVLEGVTSYQKAQDHYYAFLDAIQGQTKQIIKTTAKYNPKRIR